MGGPSAGGFGGVFIRMPMLGEVVRWGGGVEVTEGLGDCVVPRVLGLT